MQEELAEVDAPSDKTPVAGSDAMPPGADRKSPPPAGVKTSPKPAMGGLEKIAGLGIFLVGLASFGALGGLVYFILTFMAKYKVE